MEISIAHPFGNAPEKPTPSKAIMERANQKPTKWLRANFDSPHIAATAVVIGIIPYDSDELYVYRDGRGEIVYLCVVSKFDTDGRATYVQKNVWQLDGCPRGFARMVMRWFCSNGSILASDERQRKKGAEMWKRFLAEDCADRFAYVQHANGLSGLTPHTKSMLIAFAYAGNADDKIFVVSDQPITGRVRAKW
jgi:hypothetical protein